MVNSGSLAHKLADLKVGPLMLPAYLNEFITDKGIVVVSMGDPCGTGYYLISQCLDYIFKSNHHYILCGSYRRFESLLDQQIKTNHLNKDLLNNYPAVQVLSAGSFLADCLKSKAWDQYSVLPIELAFHRPANAQMDQAISATDRLNNAKVKNDNQATAKITFIDLDIDLTDSPAGWEFGAADKASGQASFNAFQVSQSICMFLIDVFRQNQQGRLDHNKEQIANHIDIRSNRLVHITMPLSKQLVGDALAADFSGHTGWLGKMYGVKPLMLLSNTLGKTQADESQAKMQVIPLTEHVAISEVSQKLTELDFEKVLAVLKLNADILGISTEFPVALLGLNPHAGEGGKIGREELELQKNWLQQAQTQGIPMQGPFAADGFFATHSYRQHSVVLGCYHDQVLVPLKMFAGFAGLNASLGLPILRLSPDHGPGYSLKNEKDASAAGTLLCLKAAHGWMEQDRV